MATWHEEIPSHSVISLLPRLHQATPPPAELPVAPRPARSTRRFFVLLAMLGALICFSGVGLLWASDSPGVLLNLIVTGMGVVIGLGLLAAVTGWNVTAAAEERARQDWRACPPSFMEGGVVVDREVVLQSESGAVSQMQLLVQIGNEQVAAGWHARGRRTVLQTQVPGIGSRVRVWRSTAGPVLVEVADPSVVEPPTCTDAH